MMNSLGVTPNDEQPKERGCFRASHGCCQILEDCLIKEVGAGGSSKSESECGDSKIERNDWSDGGKMEFEMLEEVCVWIRQIVTLVGCGQNKSQNHLCRNCSDFF